MTEKSPIREVSFRHRTDVLADPDFRAAAERSLYQALTDLGLVADGEVIEETKPAWPGNALMPAVPAMTVLTLRAKA